MTLNELREEHDRLEKLLIDTTRIDSEYYRKIHWSFSPLFFILVGFPLAIITNKREKTANVVLAIIAAAVYYLLSLGCEALAIEGIVAAQLIMMVPNLVAAAAAFYLNRKLFRM